MSFTPGARIGPFEVAAQIGEGGMGEVYQATDTNLKRAVAIKVLPALVAADAERLARFQREAEVLAALNHPNIAQIHGLEKSAGVTALVMELVEGPTLADRIARGAIPLDEALSIATQIAEALGAAHEQGIVHRDLKPANVKVRPDGTVKVLDFGLAKAMEPAPAAATWHAGGLQDVARTQSPTITSPAMTQMGVILGTAAYMAPEQASGKSVDKRADIWAFGVVVWEMLTGKQMFEGETISHVLAGVLTKEPELAAVPPRVRHLLTRCLEKDPRRRLRDIGDAMSLVLQPAAPATGDAAGQPTVTGARRWVVVGGWVAAGLLAVSLAVVTRSSRAATSEADPAIVRFQIPRVAEVYNRTTTAFAVSPDGLTLAHYGVGADGLQTLFVRTLATGEAREIQGASTAAPQAESLFWSADSRYLMRGSATGAEVFDVSSGTARTLCDCRFAGGSWNREGVILLGAFGNAREGISRLSGSDRTPVPVTTVDASKGEHDTFPAFLPDGRQFLFTRSNQAGDVATYVGTLDGDVPKRIADGSRRTLVPAASGRSAYLLGIDATGLVAQPFDLGAMTVTAAPTTVVAGAVAASASENGVLATSGPGSRPRTVPTWFDRQGRSLGPVGDSGLIESIALSRDGRKLAVAEGGDVREQGEIWLRDLVNGARTRLTFNRGGTPIWSPDGITIAFNSRRDGVNRPFQKPADGTGSEGPLFPFDGNAWANDWSSDGRWVIYSTPSSGNIGNDLWAVPMTSESEGKPVPYIVAPGLQQQAQFSPDGRFVAYASDQSGTWEIYVQPFPNASDGKWLVSSGGGAEPRWSRDGKELFYFSGQTLMVVPISMRPTFSSGSPAALFAAPVQAGYTSDSHRWQLAPDSKRFLLLANAGTDQAPPLDVVVNWPRLLKN